MRRTADKTAHFRKTAFGHEEAFGRGKWAISPSPPR